MKNNIIVSICNDAILEAGNSATITSLSDNSQLAELCSRLWKTTVNEMYSEHAWAFRKVRWKCNTSSVDSVDNTNVYKIPDGSVRILGFYLDAGYQVRDREARVGALSEDIPNFAEAGESVIFSPHAQMFIEYLSWNTTSDDPEPLVRKCITYLLAAKIATSQGKDDTKILKKYQYWLDRAEENDSSEDAAVHTYDDRFIDCR